MPLDNIFNVHREHCEETRAAHDESMEAIEAEIKEMKEKFEEDLLKIEERAKDPRGVSCGPMMWSHMVHVVVIGWMVPYCMFLDPVCEVLINF